ncbi:MAG: hypothetical protein AAGA56_07140 [Myxococcota bacterium]
MKFHTIACTCIAAAYAACSPYSPDRLGNARSADPGAGGDGPALTSSSSGAGGDGGSSENPSLPACFLADGTVEGGATWIDGDQRATVTTTGDDCRRNYSIETTATLRDDTWGPGGAPNPRSIAEENDAPFLRSGHALLDALYALTVEETRQASVDAISNFAFNDGAPVPCPPGGCFETGEKWSYVWTRDTAYSVYLGLGQLDPIRARNSLSFKVSERRGGGSPEIVQDTGTGGSWPISTDRVVWAFGAEALLPLLEGDARTEFANLTRAAGTNTLERDRKVAFDPADGLYRGEQSFLDWREQSYPNWVVGDPTQIGMSKSLSTNVGHLRLLELTARLAREAGDNDRSERFTEWATALRAAIAEELWIEEDGLFSTYKTTVFDDAAARRYDLLGQALAVLTGVGTPAQRARAVASYPHLERGAPVMWPQQQFTPIYHNRAIWPFVTALWGRAAQEVKNPAVFSHAARSLIRGAALHLSNMENFEAATGEAWLEDGDASGPIINSTRQLWSVAGFVSLIHEQLFGLDARPDGLSLNPFVPHSLHRELFGTSREVALNGIRYRGRTLSVVLALPPTPAPGDGGAWTAAEVTVNGAPVSGPIDAALVDGRNVVRVELGDAGAVDREITLVTEEDLTDYTNLYGPRPPEVVRIDQVGSALRLTLDASGETGITYEIFRDGVRVASDLAASPTWTDSSADPVGRSHCYTVETRYATTVGLAGGHRSQRSKPVCWWGSGDVRVQTVFAPDLARQGGNLTLAYGRDHIENWGDADHSVTAGFTAPSSGRYAVQVVAGNGGGGTDTGITCAVKRVRVVNGASVVATGYVAMPHLGTWNAWRESTTFELPVPLTGGQSYAVVIDEDDDAVNMSSFEHFQSYTATGGREGRFNRVNVASVKLLQLTVE